jgi:tetratricopeptide (TPR) repeat protein
MERGLRAPLTGRDGTRGTRILLAAAAFLAVSFPPSARASDFWDEVRTPGLRAYRVLVEKAERDLDAGRYAEALEKAESAVDRMSDRPPAHVVRGLALGGLKRYGEAVGAFEQALLLDRAALDDVDHGAAAVRIATRAAAYPLAALILSRLLGRMPDSPLRNALYAVQGDVLQLLGQEQLSAAVLAYRLALHNGQSGENVTLLLGLALALHREGKPEQAAELATRASAPVAVEHSLRSLALPRSERDARMAVWLESRGDFEGAGRAWSTAATEGPWAGHARQALKRLGAMEKKEGGSR